MDSAIPGRGPYWWDRECDTKGRPVRPDVRAAVLEIWEDACGRTRALLGGRLARRRTRTASLSLSRKCSSYSRSVR
jgi:hypothetical protein